MMCSVSPDVALKIGSCKAKANHRRGNESVNAISHCGGMYWRRRHEGDLEYVLTRPKGGENDKRGTFRGNIFDGGGERVVGTHDARRLQGGRVVERREKRWLNRSTGPSSRDVDPLMVKISADGKLR